MGFARQVSAGGTNLIKTDESSENYRDIVSEGLRLTFTVCEFFSVCLIREISRVRFCVKCGSSEMSFV